MINKKILLMLFIIILSTITVRFYYKDYHIKDVKQYFQDEKENTFLYDFDPYYYYEQTRDNHNSNLLSFIAFYWDKLLNIGLFGSMALLPVIFTSIASVLMFFLAYKITKNEYAGLFSALFLSINLRFLKNTYIGNPDTNSLIFVFVLAIVLICLKIKEQLQEKKYFKTSLYSLILIMSTILFSFAWNGWFYIYIIILLGLAVSYFQKLSFEKKTKYIITFIIVSCLIIVLLLIFGNYIISRIFAQRTMAKDILELQSFESFSEFIKIDFRVLMLSSFAFIIYLIIKNFTNKPVYEKTTVWLLCIWFISLAFAGYNSVRFTYHFMVVYCLIMGLLFYKIYSCIRIKESYKLLLMATIFIILLFAYNYEYKYKTLKFVPKLEVEDYYMLKDIANETPKNTLLLCWWDYGIIYESISERQSLEKSSPSEAKLISNMLLTTNESESYQIAKKLSGNRPFLVLINKEDLGKVYSMENFGNYKAKNNSMIYKFYYDDNISIYKFYKEANATVSHCDVGNTNCYQNNVIVYSMGSDS